MPSLSGANKIVLKANYTQGGAQHEEGPIAVAGLPGMNVGLGVAPDTQGRQTWSPASTDYVGTGTGATASKKPVRVLKEDALQGNTIDTPYVAGNNCFVHIALPGDVLQVLVASGQTLTKNSGVSAGANGKWVADTTDAAAEVLEDTDGALAEDSHVRVRVL